MKRWIMTSKEKRALRHLPDAVSLWYVGDGRAGVYYMSERDGRDALLAYEHRGSATSMREVKLERELVRAVDLSRGTAQVEVSGRLARTVCSSAQGWLTVREAA
jgi:hypothetical protein